MNQPDARTTQERRRAALTQASRPLSADLRNALETALSGHYGRERHVIRLRRRRSLYRSSFAIEDLALTLEDGETLSVVFKDAAWQSLAEDARAAKPAFLHDPQREIEVYQTLLAPHDIGPRYLGSAVDAARERYWLFIEKVSGVELYQVGDVGVWQDVGRWLATLHATFAPESASLAGRAALFQHDAAYYRHWPERACEFQRDAADATSFLDRLASHHDEVIERLLALPQTLLHGEFYASNVLVQVDASMTRVYPVDWEMAAIGPGVTDLAALVTGWPDEAREAIAGAYFKAALSQPGAIATRGDFDAALDCARLQLALQWLGWAQDWAPPPEHAHDWLAEAQDAAQRLGI